MYPALVEAAPPEHRHLHLILVPDHGDFLITCSRGVPEKKIEQCTYIAYIHSRMLWLRMGANIERKGTVKACCFSSILENAGPNRCRRNLQRPRWGPRPMYHPCCAHLSMKLWRLCQTDKYPSNSSKHSIRKHHRPQHLSPSCNLVLGPFCSICHLGGRD
ncbi:unnamed protein product [Somion occarium]|uniref:Uncharacterized protein n=1 Tax=Somion occarium TaxID=3059160 RepID=A0ABP1CKK8_9APHY